MKKNITWVTRGKLSNGNELEQFHFKPNTTNRATGSIVSFFHYPIQVKKRPPKLNGTNAQYYKGIATLTYILSGEVTQMDKKRGKEKIYSGGLIWVKSGRGVMYEEVFNTEANSLRDYVFGMKFWINLPSKIKSEDPAYIKINCEKIPRMCLGESIGWIKVLLGNYRSYISILPTYSRQFIYHISINAGAKFSISTEVLLEYALFVLGKALVINGIEYNNGTLIEFEVSETEIEISNISALPSEIILYGGEHYSEPITSQEAVFMNSKQEVEKACEDFFRGKYRKNLYDQTPDFLATHLPEYKNLRRSSFNKES
ncbi:MAG: pirin family protein [Sphingobacterium sp.]|nr:pirin family protein [Sphingobacterium sp.]